MTEELTQGSIVIFLAHSSFAIDLSLINLRNVPGVTDIESDLDFLMNNENLLQSYIPNEYWRTDWNN